MSVALRAPEEQRLDIEIRTAAPNSERVLFVGKTGSGKTFAARGLAAPITRLIALDPKGRLYDWGLTLWSDPSRRPWEERSRFRLRVVPSRTHGWDAYLQPIADAMWDGWEDAGDRDDYVPPALNIVIYIDELFGFLQDAVARGPLLSLLSRGREAGIGVWFAVQRPAWILKETLSEADWVFEFRLQLEDDRRRMRELVGDMAMYPLREHNVLVYNTGWDEPLLYRQLNLQPMANRPSYRRGL